MSKILSIVIVVASLMLAVGCSSSLTHITREQSIREMVRANKWPEPSDSGYVVRDSLQDDLLVDRMMHKKSNVKAHQGYNVLVVNYTDSAKIIEIYKRRALFIVDLIAGPFYLGEGGLDSCRLPPGLYENRVYSVGRVIEAVNDREVTILPTVFNINGEEMKPNGVFGIISPRWASFGHRRYNTRYGNARRY